MGAMYGTMSHLELADLHTKFSGASPPPTGPNYFVFSHIFTEKDPHQRSTPPTGLCPPREILDPPLFGTDVGSPGL